MSAGRAEALKRSRLTAIRKRLRVMVNQQLQQLRRLECDFFLRRQNWHHSKLGLKDEQISRMIKATVNLKFRQFCNGLSPDYLNELREEPRYFIRNDPSATIPAADIIALIRRSSDDLSSFNGHYFHSTIHRQDDTASTFLPRVASLLHHSYRNDFQSALQPDLAPLADSFRSKRELSITKEIQQSTFQRLLPEGDTSQWPTRRSNLAKKRIDFVASRPTLEESKQSKMLKKYRRTIKEKLEVKRARTLQRIREKEEQLLASSQRKQAELVRRKEKSVMAKQEKHQKMKENLQIFKLTKRLEQTVAFRPRSQRTSAIEAPFHTFSKLTIMKK